MKLCFVADVRSPIALNWMRYFVESGHDVHVISSYPYFGTPLPGARIYVVPLAFSGMLRWNAPVQKTLAVANEPASARFARLMGGPLYPLLAGARHRLAPVEVWRHVRTVRRLVAGIQPDLVHAMRIPYEGILASLAVQDVPLLISVWGNDFTFHAKRDRLVGVLSRHALKRVDALHCDCFRDLRLAHQWGLDPSKLTVVLPGAGGVRTDIFRAGRPARPIQGATGIPAGSPVIVNPRGFRQYVRNDAFFQAIPLVLQRHPTAVFLCSGMEHHPLAQKFVQTLGIGSSVRLLPLVPHNDMADVFRLAGIAVSPSEHDGTPNTLLEAMACGCFPVAGDIESIREWITDGVNGLLCDPGNPHALADAILRAIERHALRESAASVNTGLIAARADYRSVMPQAAAFYERLINQSGNGMSEEPCAASPA